MPEIIVVRFEFEKFGIKFIATKSMPPGMVSVYGQALALSVSESVSSTITESGKNYPLKGETYYPL